jgi:hypothetical protein
VARATRQAAHETYQARLDEAVTETTALSAQAASLQRQLAKLRQAMGRLPSVSESILGKVSFNTLSAYLTERSQIATQIARLRGNLDQSTIALDTLLGMPLDDGAHSHLAHSL